MRNSCGKGSAGPGYRPEKLKRKERLKAMARKALTPAVAYLRTSSAANTGADKDSGKRQRAAIDAFARSAILDTYYDEAVSGADPVTSRPGFAAMMERIASDGVRVIIVETANRFARDLIVQETAFAMLKGQGVELIAADKPDAFLDDTPTANLIRQVLGAVSQFEKAMVVAKLKGARDRKRRETGRKVEGRKSYAERDANLVRLAKRLHRYPINGRRRSLRDVSKALAGLGYLASSGKPYGAAAVARMVERK
jgi:DNA invertase Pin-like site-specific DNA recombinase